MKKKIPTDRERLDWLEQFVREKHFLTLHDSTPTILPLMTYGLSFGRRTKRSLRDAIDSCEGWTK